MASNPVGNVYSAIHNPIGYGVNEAYNSSYAKSDTSTGKSNIANALKGAYKYGSSNRVLRS